MKAPHTVGVVLALSLVATFAIAQAAETAAPSLPSFCTPEGAAKLGSLTRQLRAANPDDGRFLEALDKAVGFDHVLRGSDDVVTISGTAALAIVVIPPYRLYRTAVSDKLRNRESIENLQIPNTVMVAVRPRQINSPDIVMIMVERDGWEVDPLESSLVPTNVATRLDARTVLHSGDVVYPCSAFAPGASVQVTAVPAVGQNIVQTIPSAQLATLR